MTAVKRLALLGLALAVALGGGLAYWTYRGRRDDDAIRLSGNIEAVEVKISFKIPGRVQKRLVDEGDPVYKDREVAELETDDLKADLEQRKADVRTAQAALEELENGSRVEEINAAQHLMDKAYASFMEMYTGSRPQEIQSAEADLKATSVERDRLETEMRRAERLYLQQAIPTEQYDQARAAFRVADERKTQAQKRYDLVKEGPRQEQIDQAWAGYLQARSQYRLVADGPRFEVVQQARGKLALAKAALQLSQTRLDYATVASPLTGVVLSKNAEEGEFVAAGTPVVTVADIEHVWLRAYVDELHVGKGALKWGQEAEITTDSMPDKKYKGQVAFISSQEEFTPKSVQTEKERVKLVYRIKINILNPDRELKPGMPADARILPTHAAAEKP